MTQEAESNTTRRTWPTTAAITRIDRIYEVAVEGLATPLCRICG
jgi:hypothetical protein